jgi:hypothetical protein
MRIPKLAIVATMLLSLGTSIATSAQISAYDSMYFPTTQSLEGTRQAPRMYSILEVEFGELRSDKPRYFSELKESYFKQVGEFAFDFSQSDIAVLSNKPGTQTQRYLASHTTLSELQSTVKTRLIGIQHSNMHELMGNITVEQLDDVNANTFDFRNGSDALSNEKVVSISRLDGLQVEHTFAFE